MLSRFSSRVPVISIVGRTNVGKSSLFNKIVGRRISIVHDSEGVTRDVVSSSFVWNGRQFDLIDSGGLEFCPDDPISSQVEEQVKFAINSSDLILFVVDFKSGLIPLDLEISKMLKKIDKPVVVCVNKCDIPGDEASVCDFYSLPFDDIVPISSTHGHGTGDLLDLICSRLNFEENCEDVESIRVSIIGKPNVGKSSLVNRLCGRNRSIISDVSGTTRDALDTLISDESGTCFTLVDTAGIRRKNNLKGDIEKYSTFRAYDSVESCDICLVVIDACEWITSQDVKIVGITKNNCKPCIILVNKWDKLESSTENVLKFDNRIKEMFKFIPYAKIIYISAKTGKNCNKILDAVKAVFENSKRRIPTGILNSFLERVMLRTPSPSIKGRQLKIYYITQSNVSPPTFVFFVNDRKLMHFSYQRHLEKKIREEFDFSGVCIKISLKQRSVPSN